MSRRIGAWRFTSECAVHPPSSRLAFRRSSAGDREARCAAGRASRPGSTTASGHVRAGPTSVRGRAGLASRESDRVPMRARPRASRPVASARAWRRGTATASDRERAGLASPERDRAPVRRRAGRRARRVTRAAGGPGGGRGRPYLRILLKSVVRLMSRARAVAWRFQSCARSVRSMISRSGISRARLSGSVRSPVGAGAERVSSGGRSPGIRMSPRARITPRSMTFSSSRMLPGQAWAWRIVMVPSSISATFLLFSSLKRLRKCWARSGTSEIRSRSGGRWIGPR